MQTAPLRRLFAGLSSRRTFLVRGGVLTFAPWLAARVDGAVRKRVKFSAPPFQLGVASGAPSPRGVVLWTRLAPQPLEGGGMPAELVQVRWQVARDENFNDVVREGDCVATPQLAHAVHVEVDGLAPDRWYWYRFAVGEEVSPVGQTRTTPEFSAEPSQLRFAFASCQHYEQGYYTAFRHMAEEGLDMVAHLGDYIYEGAAQEDQIRKHTGGETVSLREYRERYALYKTDPDLQAAHAACPWMVTWDDHEFDNNYAGDISEEDNIDPVKFLARRADAYQAYYEHMPLGRASLPRGPQMRLYRRIPFGRLASFFVLDTRQYRSDQPNGDGLKPLVGSVLDPSTTMLGERQERWLHSGLLDSPSNWNVLAQQVMLARVDRLPGPVDGYSMDKWAGYDAATKRLLGFLADRRVPNPVVLTGDIHNNYVNDLKVDFDDEQAPAIGTEFVGTSISSGGDGPEKLAYTDGMLAENPFIKFHNAERGYVSCTVTPDEWRSDYQVVPYVTRRGAPRITRASFVVQSGKPGAERT